MRVVLGLGNEGPEYRFTRHNAGFMVADAIAARCGAVFTARGDLGRLTWTAEAEFAGERIVLAKPRTLMNRSGQAAAALRRKFAAEVADVLVVHDDADLAFGRVRVRPEGGAGGHNGLRSLIEVLGSNAFPRIKLGVLGEGRHGSDLAAYVLDLSFRASGPGSPRWWSWGPTRWGWSSAKASRRPSGPSTDPRAHPRGHESTGRRGRRMVACALRVGEVPRPTFERFAVRTVTMVRHPSPPARPEAIRREEVHVIRTYETVFITDPTLTDEDERSVVDALGAIVTDGGGTFAANDRMGRRRLAYPIKKFEDGVYTRFLYDADSGVPKELDRRLRISDKVIRHMTVAMELDWAVASKEQAVRDAQARAEAEAARAAGLLVDEAPKVSSVLTDASDAPPDGRDRDRDRDRGRDRDRERDDDDIDFDDQA